MVGRFIDTVCKAKASYGRSKDVDKAVRRHVITTWKERDLQFLLTHYGLKPMRYIAEQLGRTERSVGQKVFYLKIDLFSNLGLPLSAVVSFVKNYLTIDDALLVCVRRQAGYLQIMPWMQVDELCRKDKLEVSDDMRTIIRAMASYQRFLYDVKHNKNGMQKIRRIAGEEAEWSEP